MSLSPATPLPGDQRCVDVQADHEEQRSIHISCSFNIESFKFFRNSMPSHSPSLLFGTQNGAIGTVVIVCSLILSCSSNNSGTRESVHQRATTIFRQLDTNGDGIVTRDDLVQFFQVKNQRYQKYFSRKIPQNSATTTLCPKCSSFDSIDTVAFPRAIRLQSLYTETGIFLTLLGTSCSPTYLFIFV